VEVIAGSYTLELTRYELGNSLRKEHAVQRHINSEELKRLIRLVKTYSNSWRY